MIGVDGLGPPRALPELEPTVERDASGAYPWSVRAAGLDRLQCRTSGKRTRREVAAAMAAPGWREAWDRFAAGCAERLGLLAPAPSPPSACSPRDREPLCKLRDPLGEWPGCVDAGERNGRIADADLARIVRTMPDHLTRLRAERRAIDAGEPLPSFTCAAVENKSTRST